MKFEMWVFSPIGLDDCWVNSSRRGCHPGDLGIVVTDDGIDLGS